MKLNLQRRMVSLEDWGLEGLKLIVLVLDIALLFTQLTRFGASNWGTN